MNQIDEPARELHKFSDPGFTPELIALLRPARWGAARTEEVMATTDRSPEGRPCSCEAGLD